MRRTSKGRETVKRSKSSWLDAGTIFPSTMRKLALNQMRANQSELETLGERIMRRDILMPIHHLYQAASIQLIAARR